MSETVILSSRDRLDSLINSVLNGWKRGKVGRCMWGIYPLETPLKWLHS